MSFSVGAVEKPTVYLRVHSETEIAAINMAIAISLEEQHGASTGVGTGLIDTVDLLKDEDEP